MRLAVDRDLPDAAPCGPPRRSSAAVARGSRRRSAIATPARRRSSAASRPRSSTVRTTARSPGLQRPEVDEPANGGREHHADEIVARGRRAAGRARPSRRRRARRGTGSAGCRARPGRGRPRRRRSRVAGERISTPAVGGRCGERRPAAIRLRIEQSRSPPGAGPSSTRATWRPASAAAIAASSPDWPPPITSTSTWRCSTS